MSKREYVKKINEILNPLIACDSQSDIPLCCEYH